MSAVKKAPCPNRGRGSKNRNPVETLSMLNSRRMANSRRRVLVTELEYRKAEASFSSAPGLECLRAPGAEADLALAIREAHASYVIVGASTYSGALYDALPAGGGIARVWRGQAGTD